MADKTKEFNDKGKIRLLVYGTLKGGHGNHQLLKCANAHFMHYDSITGPFRMNHMVGFPGIFRLPESDLKRPDHTMKGEVWAVEPEGLAAIDMLEGHPNFYRREKMWTDKNTRVWVYLMSPGVCSRRPDLMDEERRVKDGIWSANKEEQAYWKNQATA